MANKRTGAVPHGSVQAFAPTTDPFLNYVLETGLVEWTYSKPDPAFWIFYDNNGVGDVLALDGAGLDGAVRSYDFFLPNDIPPGWLVQVIGSSDGVTPDGDRSNIIRT